MPTKFGKRVTPKGPRGRSLGKKELRSRARVTRQRDMYVVYILMIQLNLLISAETRAFMFLDVMFDQCTISALLDTSSSISTSRL